MLDQPGLVTALEMLAEEGAASVYRGSLAEALLAVDGVVFTAGDLRDYRRAGATPIDRRASTDIASRHEAGSRECPSSCRASRGLQGSPSASASSRSSPRSRHAERGGEHTTNMVAVDGHGRACVLTHSLGVGAGVWLPGFDVQLNNLLGESDIAFGDPQPGDHLQSRMAPSLAFDGDGLALAIGAAGATSLRTALATVLAGVLDEGLDPETAVARPRVHPTPELVDAEPGVDEEALDELEARGRTVRRWERFHHYFGGVSCVGSAGAAGDPRRSGAAIVL